MSLSVIIPVYNGARYLAETLDSVFAQTVPADEIVVIDDGSTDNSPDILNSLKGRLTIRRQENQGVAAARNAGLAIASGDLISFIDQDDIWPADRNRILLDALQADPAAEVACGRVEILYQRSTPPLDPRQHLAAHREYLMGSLLIRSRLFKALGPLNTSVDYADDTDFWFRRAEAEIPTVYLDAVTLIYRLHDTNTSLDSSRSNGLFLTVLRERLKRRRLKHANKLHNPDL